MATEVRQRWVEGDKAAAAAAVPDELILAAHPIGTEDMVRARVAAMASAGVDAMRVSPQGRTVADQIEHLEMAVDLIRSSTS